MINFGRLPWWIHTLTTIFNLKVIGISLFEWLAVLNTYSKQYLLAWITNASLSSWKVTIKTKTYDSARSPFDKLRWKTIYALIMYLCKKMNNMAGKFNLRYVWLATKTRSLKKNKWIIISKEKVHICKFCLFMLNLC